MTAAALCLTAVLLATPPTAASQPGRYEFMQIQMGMPFTITLYSADEALANKAARAAHARVKELNAILSDYDPDSELMRLCRSSGPGKPVKVSPELFFVLQKSLAFSQQSDGAFDVTVGPIVDLWRRARRKRELPDPDQLAAALEKVGHEKIRLNEKDRTVELLVPGMRLDLGGIAKGYAADEALRVLREHGITVALIAAAGDITAGDPPPGRDAWRVGIAPFGEPGGKPARFVNLKNAAISTSGDAFQFVELAGTRYSHIVDPMTGLGLTTRSSATVIAANGITADALASAVSVLGPERGMELIERTKGVEALIVFLKDGRPVPRESKWFGGMRDEG